MIKTPLYNQKAEVIGEVELNGKIFGVKPSVHLLAEAVRIQQSNARQGSSHTKTRGEVSGGGKKPWKQKGTGRARAGSIRSPIWRKGGIVFGPRANRNWELKLNKKARTKALFMSLSDKAEAGNVVILDAVEMKAPKTKEFTAILSGLRKSAQGLGKKPLFVLPGVDQTLVRASRNIPSVKTVPATSLSVLDVLTADSLLVMKDSLPVIEKIYLKK